ncbi:hypothetical protein vseg_014529 [Gypsophila vaccaria]
MSSNKDFPTDVWSEILARLPVKTLVRFRSVNKHLRSIIDDPYFMYTHLKHYNNNSHYDKTQLISLHITREDDFFKACKISLRNYDTLTETTKLVHTRDEAYAFLGSCLGLMLMICYYPRRLLRLWNPSIRKSIVIPPCPFPTSHFLHVAYALGFSPSTRRFKVVAFQVNKTWSYSGPMSVAVYTVGDDKNLWRIITHDCGIVDVPIRGAQCYMYWTGFLYFQGGVHWITSDRNIGSSCNECTHLMSFDFDSEKVSCVALPDAMEEDPGYRSEFLLGETMAYASITEIRCRIWVMNKNEDSGDVSWNLWFSSADTERENGRLWPLVNTVFYVDNGSFSFRSKNSSYDIATSKSRKLLNLSDDDTFTLDTYLESLALCSQGKAFP